MWPEAHELAPYGRREQLAIVAHAVQSVADGEWSAVPAYSVRASKIIGDARDEHALKVLGAVGRALAAVGSYQEARNALRASLQGWLRVSAGAASYALCEVLRVEGILGAKDEVTRLRDVEWAEVEAALSADSRSFVSLALGRALAQVGAVGDALTILERGVSAHAPTHVKAAAYRWRAMAARAIGDETRMREALELLDALGDSDQRQLARLDSEQLDAHDTERCLDILLSLSGDGDEARRLLRRLAPGLSTRDRAATRSSSTVTCGVPLLMSASPTGSNVRQNPSKPPRWLTFLEDALDQKPKLYNASNGALLLIRRGKRTFALSLGHGRHLLQPGIWEENFGLRETLNSVDPGRLTSVDRKTFDAISRHTRTQASQDGDVHAFGLNVEQDLLRAAKGWPTRYANAAQPPRSIRSTLLAEAWSGFCVAP